MCWASLTPSSLQRIECDGGGSVEAFSVGGRQMLGLAEFNKGVVAVYVLQGAHPDERFVPWQRVSAPGVGAFTTLSVEKNDGGEQLLLVAASEALDVRVILLPPCIFH
jgi:hypothetical protein